MGADIRSLLSALGAFYDFSGKDVLLVGGGGGQLLEGVRSARRVVAVDLDPGALSAMEAQAKVLGLEALVEPLLSNWIDVSVKADVVYFEFSLHEMSDPDKALAHARTLAPEIVVFDHEVDSPWARVGGEADLVRRGFDAMVRCGIRESRLWRGVQRFKDYAELQARLALDPRARAMDISGFLDREALSIPMDGVLVRL